MARFQRILCPVDFFPASVRALAHAVRLAAKNNARLKLLHVVSVMLPTGYDVPMDTTPIIEQMETGARHQLTKLLSRLGMSQAQTEVEVARGDVSTEIQKAIASFKPDLVAMGTHGHRGFERWILGSTTERLLRSSPVPVLVISAAQKGAAAAPRLRRILVTTDFSEDTTDALQYALFMAEMEGAHLTLLHVLEEMRAITSAEYRADQAARAKSKLEKLARGSGGLVDVDARVEAGTPYHVILMMLKKLKIDLLVMNMHGKGMLDRALLGSTTNRVVKGAPCPVLLIPPDKARSMKA